MRAIDNLSEGGETGGIEILATVPTSESATFAQGLTALQPYYNALTDTEKRNSYLQVGNEIFPYIQDTGSYGGVASDSTATRMNTLNIPNATYYRFTINHTKSSGSYPMEYKDRSSLTRNFTLTFYIKR